MIVGCYSLALYCDGPGCLVRREGDGVFTAETGAECRREARKRGWRLNLRAGTALCPQCVKNGKRVP